MNVGITEHRVEFLSLGEAITPVELLGYALSLTAFGAYNYFRLKEM